MKIALINASPKVGASSSRTLMGMLSKTLSCNYETVELHKPSLSDEQLAVLSDCEAWVFAFPLYIDSIPSHLLSCMCQLEEQMQNKNVCVYAMVNCGFYEGHQTESALAVMENWCIRSGFTWGMGIGFGGGGGLGFLEAVPAGHGPLTSLGKIQTALSEAIEQGRSCQNLTTSIDFPRFLYKLGAEQMWKQQCASNGLKPKDLDRRL